MPFAASLPFVLPGEDDPTTPDVDESVADPLAAVDHAASALARLAEQFKNKANLAALLNAINVQSQDVETALQDLLSLRSVDTAFGAQLDVLGAIVGQPRGGFDDDAYRLYISARVLLNISSGTIPEVIAIFRALVDDTTTIEFEEQFPAGFVLRLGGQAFTPTMIQTLIGFLRSARAGGVRGLLEWFESDPADVFRFDTGPGLDQGHFAGALI